MERLLLDIDESNIKIIGSRYNESTKGYDLKFKCKNCGFIGNTKLVSNKRCVLRCSTCKSRIYLIPYTGNRDNSLVLGFDLLLASEYDKIIRHLKKSGEAENMLDGIKEILKEMRKI